mgnify:FL=1|jgi:HAD phosphoserine phosphatase-like hydrolase, family IB
MSNFKKTFQLVAVFLFVSVVQLSAQTYKYQKIVGFSDETNAKLEAFLQSTISMNIRKVAVFDCDGTLFGQVPYYLAEEALYEYARRNYAGKKDAKSVEKFKLVDKMIHEDAISRERDRIKFLSGMTPEEIQRIGDDCFHEKYQNKFYPQMKALLTNLRNYGFETWVISASPELLYQRFCVEELGFQEDRVIGVKSLVTMGGVVTDQIVFPSPQDEGKAEVIRTFIKTRPLFAAGNSRGDMEMMNTSVGLKLILNPDAKTPQKVMGGKTVKEYWAADPNCITEYTRDVTEGNYNWACDEYKVKQNAPTDVSTPAVVIY